MKVSGPETRQQLGDSLDIFVFDNDKAMRLDSYQRMASVTEGRISIASGSGDKIIFALANSGRDRFGWYDVNCYQSLEKIYVKLEDESRDSPAMSAWTTTDTSEKGEAAISLECLCSEIVVGSIRSDFSGQPYQGEKILGAKAYLMNVNAEYPVCGQGEYGRGATRLVNTFHLDEGEMNRFSDKGLLVQEFPTGIGDKPLTDGISLRCFPNTPENESAGSPMTRLVIEGRIEGETYYWAFPAGGGGQEKGVGRNMRYIYDITINRKGTTSPDQDADVEDATIMMKVERWTEKGNYDVMF